MAGSQHGQGGLFQGLSPEFVLSWGNPQPKTRVKGLAVFVYWDTTLRGQAYTRTSDFPWGFHAGQLPLNLPQVSIASNHLEPHMLFLTSDSRYSNLQQSLHVHGKERKNRENVNELQEKEFAACGEIKEDPVVLVS